MAVLKTVTLLDAVFLLSVGSLLASALLRDSRGRWLAVGGWFGFGGFWLSQAAAYFGVDRAFLGVVSLVSGFLSLYCVRLVVADDTVGWRLTVAFGVMGAVFVPYQFLDPVFHGVVRLVTVHSVFVLSTVGFEPTVVAGDVAPGTAIRFANTPWMTFSVVSACTGLSAIAMFVGFLSISETSVRRRLAGAVGITMVIYALNVIRIVVVLGATAGRWFASAEPVIEPLYGVSDPARVSYYFAEYLFAQVSIVIVLLGVAGVLLRLFPDLGALLGQFNAQVQQDLHWLGKRQ